MTPATTAASAAPAEPVPWRIGPLHIPSSADDADAAEFIAANDLSNLTEGLLWGNNDHWVSAENRLAGAQSTEYTTCRSYIATVDERVVGRADVELPLKDNTRAGYVHVTVHPEYKRRGLGAQLYVVLEKFMRSEGRDIGLTWSDHAADFDVDSPEGVRPGSGPGTLPRNNGVVRFCQSMGYVLEQVERFSVLHLPVDTQSISGVAASAQQAGNGYEVVSWQDRCPDDVVGEYSRLCRQMSVDIPLGDLQWEAEKWDARRVREEEDKLRQQGGHSLVAVARRTQTGELAGHSVIEYFPERPEVAYQENTLVLQAHRGHRLGMLLKASNLLWLQKQRPQVHRLYTWNAAENSHMLEINIELGFVPAGYVGAWQKTLARDGHLDSSVTQTVSRDH